MKYLSIILILTMIFAACAQTTQGDATKGLKFTSDTSTVTKDRTLPTTPQVTDVTTEENLDAIVSQATIVNGIPQFTVSSGLGYPLFSALTDFYHTVNSESLSSLRDGNVTINGTSYVYREELLFLTIVPEGLSFGASSASELAIKDGLGLTTADSEFFADKVIVPASTYSLGYQIRFEESYVLNMVSSQNPINLRILGREITLTGINIDNDPYYPLSSITYRFNGREYTAENHDPFINEDVDDPAWEWDLSELEWGKIKVMWALDIDRPDEDENPRYTRPLYVGENYRFPNGYSVVEFTSVEPNIKPTITVSTSFEDLHDRNGNVMYSNAGVIKVQFDGPDSLQIWQEFSLDYWPGTLTDTFYLYDIGERIGVFGVEPNGSDAYIANPYGVSGTAGFFGYAYSGPYSTTIMSIKEWDGDSGYLQFDSPSGPLGIGSFKIRLQSNGTGNSSGPFYFLGDGIDDIGMENDLVWIYDKNNNLEADLSYREADLLLNNGVRFVNPDQTLSNDEVIFQLPQHYERTVFTIKGWDGTLDPIIEDPVSPPSGRTKIQIQDATP